MRGQPWRRDRTYRYLVRTLLGLLAANLLYLGFTGRWANFRVALVWLVMIVLATVLRLLVAYWEKKDNQHAARLTAGAAGDIEPD